jgi:hypothetical protein
MNAVAGVRRRGPQRQDIADADPDRLAQRERQVDRQPVGVLGQAVQARVTGRHGQLDPGHQAVEAAGSGDFQPQVPVLPVGLLIEPEVLEHAGRRQQRRRVQSPHVKTQVKGQAGLPEHRLGVGRER